MIAPGASLAHASAIRAATFGIWLVTVAVTPYPLYSRFPSELQSGFGLGRVFTDIPIVKQVVFAYWTLMLLKVTAVAGCLAVLLTAVRPHVAAVVTLNIVVLDSLTKAMGGFANHGQSAPLMFAILFALLGDRPFLSAAGTWRAWRHRTSAARDVTRTTRHDDAVVWITASLLALPYTYIGINRIVHGGVDIFRGDAILYYVGAASRSFQANSVLSDETAREILRYGFAMTTVMEACSVGILFWRPFRLTWLAVIGSFHVLTVVFMNIFFWENLVLGMVVLLPRWSSEAVSQNIRSR